jgi:hypothetical protein
MTHIAAIGSNGLEPVVWGVGDTREEAEEDARGYTSDAYPAPKLEYVDIDDAQLANVIAGVVSCAQLGIEP